LKRKKKSQPAYGLNDWFIVHDAAGDLTGIYGVGVGSKDYPDILQSLPAGATVTRTTYEGAVKYVGLFGGDSEKSRLEDIKRILTEMVNEAVDQVCGLRARPAEFSMDAEVKVSIGVGGSVKFGMVWKTEEMCKP